jgi:hypothetical protein
MDIPPSVLRLRPKTKQIHAKRAEFNLTYELANWILHLVMKKFYNSCKVLALGDERARQTNLSEGELNAVHQCMVANVSRLVGKGAVIPLDVILGKSDAEGYSPLIEMLFGENNTEARRDYFSLNAGPHLGWLNFILQHPAQLPLAIDFIAFGAMPAIAIINLDTPEDMIQYHMSISTERLRANESNGRPMLQGYHFTNWFYPDEHYARRKFYTNQGKKIFSKQHAKKLGQYHSQRIGDIDYIQVNNANNASEGAVAAEGAVSVEPEAAVAAASKPAASTIYLLPNNIEKIPKSYLRSDVQVIDETGRLGVIFYNQSKNEVGRFPIASVEPLSSYEYQATILNKAGKPILKSNGKPLVITFLKDDDRNAGLPQYIAPDEEIPVDKKNTITLNSTLSVINNSDSSIAQALRDWLKAYIINDPISDTLLFILANEYYLDTASKIKERKPLKTLDRNTIIETIEKIGEEYKTLFDQYMKIVGKIYSNKGQTDEQKRQEINNIVGQKATEAAMIKSLVPNIVSENVLKTEFETHPLLTAYNKLLACVTEADKVESRTTAEVETLVKECFREFHPIYKQYTSKKANNNDEAESIKHVVESMTKMPLTSHGTYMDFYVSYIPDFERLAQMKARRNAKLKKKGGAITRRRKRTTKSRWRTRSRR